MKGQKLLKLCSVVMILACLFGLVAGGLGISDVVDVKQAKEAEKAETLEQIDTLAAGVEQLESKRADYEAGKAAYEQCKESLRSAVLCHSALA